MDLIIGVDEVLTKRAVKPRLAQCLLRRVLGSPGRPITT